MFLYYIILYLLGLNKVQFQSDSQNAPTFIHRQQDRAQFPVTISTIFIVDISQEPVNTIKVRVSKNQWVSNSLVTHVFPNSLLVCNAA